MKMGIGLNIVRQIQIVIIICQLGQFEGMIEHCQMEE